MKKILKSVFNLKTILSCYISAIGYGIGYNLPSKLGWHPIVCILCCILLGFLFDYIAKKILSSKYFNQSLLNQYRTAALIYFGYLAAWITIDYYLDYDLDYDFLTNVVFIVAIQILLLIIDAVKKYIKEKTIKDNKK